MKAKTMTPGTNAAFFPETTPRQARWEPSRFPCGYDIELSEGEAAAIELLCKWQRAETDASRRADLDAKSGLDYLCGVTDAQADDFLEGMPEPLALSAKAAVAACRAFLPAYRDHLLSRGGGRYEG